MTDDEITHLIKDYALFLYEIADEFGPGTDRETAKCDLFGAAVNLYKLAARVAADGE